MVNNATTIVCVFMGDVDASAQVYVHNHPYLFSGRRVEEGAIAG